MHPEILKAFFETADENKCLIGLREPNPLAEKWIAKEGCMPKGANCKAKTADNPSFVYSGLVVDPFLVPKAFTDATLPSAQNTWKSKFLIKGHVPLEFTVTETGPQRGLLKQDNLNLYSDYDLMTIVPLDERGEKLPGYVGKDEEFYKPEIAKRKALWAKVEKEINNKIGVRIIQHGDEFTYEDDIGAREFEAIIWFGPHRQMQRSYSSMPGADLPLGIRRTYGH